MIFLLFSPFKTHVLVDRILSYLSFFARATNAHSIHSPFVYQFVTACLYQSKKHTDLKFRQFKSYKKQLLSDPESISVTDFGAGSKVFKTPIRNISAIAKTAGISDKKAPLLLKIVEYFKPRRILELGTSLGMSTYCMYLGNPDAQITSLEGCPETAGIAQKYLSNNEAGHIEIITGDFNYTLPKILNTSRYDMIYFDGNHRKQPTIDYFKAALENAGENTFFIFDDIHWSKEMEEAWAFIKTHPKVTVSIDLYIWGLVFFRKEQVKEHFNIRV